MQELFTRYLFHWTPERAIWLGSQTLSWDARCAGIYAGFGIALIYHLMFRRLQTALPPRSTLITAAVLFLPLFIDVATIHYAVRTPLNLIRHLTGIWFGIAFCCLVYPAVMQLSNARRIFSTSQPLTSYSLLLLATAGIALSSLTLGNRIFSYYLLESLSWLGLIGLTLLSITGFAGLLRHRQ